MIIIPEFNKTTIQEGWFYTNNPIINNPKTVSKKQSKAFAFFSASQKISFIVTSNTIPIEVLMIRDNNQAALIPIFTPRNDPIPTGRATRKLVGSKIEFVYLAINKGVNTAIPSGMV